MNYLFIYQIFEFESFFYLSDIFNLRVTIPETKKRELKKDEI